MTMLWIMMMLMITEVMMKMMIAEVLPIHMIIQRGKA